MKSSINSNDSTRKQAALDQVTLKKLLHYDPKTGIFTWLVKRSNGAPEVGSVAGRLQNGKYWNICINKTNYKAHRLAWLYMTGEWPEHEIDHEDLNKINNKWKNLRQATGSQNKANIRAQANNKLGVKGVIQRPYNRFEVNLKRKYIGTFDTIEEASKAYEAAAKEYYGEFTRIE